MGTQLTHCSHTGITVPECSCRSCLEALIAEHMPSLLAGGKSGATGPQVIGQAHSMPRAA